MDYTEFDAQNHKHIAEFLEYSKQSDCDITGSVKATLAQFLMNFRLEINRLANKFERNWLTPEEIIDCQVSELRRCIIDLEAYKERLTKGVIKQ